MQNKTEVESVDIKAYARLHMGFFNLNGEQGRRFGSLGIGLDWPYTKIKISRGRGNFTTQKDMDADTLQHIEKRKKALLTHLNIKEEVTIEAIEQIPRHAGLGSGTQMALAIGTGLNSLFNQSMTLSDIANITGRGQRSGIGIGTFSQGGFVLDGGRGDHTQLPPIIAQHAVPDDWRFILIFDPSFEGVHGHAEVSAFQSLANQSLIKTQTLTHRILTKALPSLLEQDIAAFGEVMNDLQNYNGEYFAPAQGDKYASQPVAEVLAYLNTQGVACVGQSSWGPTGFAMIKDQAEAESLLLKIKAKFENSRLDFVICRPCNHGAQVNIHYKV